MVRTKKVVYDQVLERLKNGRNNIRRSELMNLLQSLGFEVKHGATGNHHTVSHPGLGKFGFQGSNFDGGHNSDSIVKACYIRNMKNLLQNYKEFWVPEGSDDDN